MMNICISDLIGQLSSTPVLNPLVKLGKGESCTYFKKNLIIATSNNKVVFILFADSGGSVDYFGRVYKRLMRKN